MSTFFHNFPRVSLEIDGRIIQYHDIYRFVNILKDILPSYNQYNIYTIQDGERPDNVAQRLYKNSDYYWTIFIVNDRLKNGISEWPMSSQELDSYIKNKYNNLGVIEVKPTFDNVPSNLTQYYQNIFGLDTLGVPILNGFDWSWKWLRVKRTISNSDKFAKIYQYDSNRGQLWVTDVNDKFFYDQNQNKDFKIVLNPYTEGTDEYDAVEQENSSWYETIKTDWYEPIFGTYSGSDFKSDVEAILNLTAFEYYENAYIAPDYYLLNDKKVSYIDHYLIYGGGEGGGFPVPNYEVEREKNEEKRAIRVVKSEYIQSFVDKYKKLIKSSSRLRI
jgi:hypothetical protein